MTTRETLMGALLLRRGTFAALRERSDVFLRGFLVLLVVGIVVGLFMGLEGASRELLPPPTKEQVIATALESFNAQYTGPAAMRSEIEPYVVDIASLVYEILVLSPRAGEIARPISTVLVVIGTTLTTPFSSAWAGWLLFAGLVFHLTSRWLGGRAAMSQMLGLTALAAAPQLLLVIGSLLGILQNISGAPIGILSSLIVFIVAIWSALVYIFATSVAQGFSLLRAVGAIALGFAVLIGVLIVLVVLFGLLVGLIVLPLAGAIQ